MAFSLASIVGTVRGLRTTFSKEQHVRIVTMNGCMADVRANIREGTIIRFTKRVLYDGGKGTPVTMACIRLADGTVDERVCDPQNDWVLFEGVWEFRE